MTKVVCIINLKGGVGKTSITVALAEFLVELKGQKVLVIDLDPQTNSTVSLIGEEEWEERNKSGKTLYHLFKDYVDDTMYFNLRDSIVRKSSNLKDGLENLHVLPSSLDFITIQDRLIQIANVSFIRPSDVLKQSVKPYLGDYDVVLIDCPPNLGFVTQNGLTISDYYLIPTIPDHLSTYGIPQIISSVSNFNRKTGGTVEPLGIVASMYRGNVSRHNLTLRTLRTKAAEGELPRLFKTKIPLASKGADATYFDEDHINTLKQKYGYTGSPLYEAYYHLTEEFRQYVGL